MYLGNQECQILAYDDSHVRLYDVSFPIINRELLRDDFDRMMRENPLNDHLLVAVAEVPEVAAKQPLSD